MSVDTPAPATPHMRMRQAGRMGRISTDCVGVFYWRPLQPVRGRSLQLPRDNKGLRGNNSARCINARLGASIYDIRRTLCLENLYSVV